MNGYGDIYTDDELDRNYDMDATTPGWVEEVEQHRGDVRAAAPRHAAHLRPRRARGLAVVHRSDQLVLLQAPDGWRG